ncbi:DUF4130 domain-containing protein [Variovorax sp. J22P168]|uniref:DUF4130 domain-containing protein n=1 Tax=Variovorax jilinensis TaxID=3053513 RepID=UPI0025787A5D|nr:DUF4130 domain-containing protein [Variovorax sp. J22P168]MDM0014237.1 DUF4130 domain-containing protein [Variovorax sp. J22P168]
MSQHIVTLDGETDSIGFRREARALLAALVAPDEVSWLADARHARQRFSRDPASPAGGQRAGTPHPLLPRSFMTLCETVLLHSAPQRFALLYRLLWRLVHEPGLQRNPLDADRLQALHLAQAVRRDMQKMKNLAQFDTVDGSAADEDAFQLAWFDPEHHIVEAMAPFFLRRLSPMHWALLTPERSVRWDGQLLEFGPGVPDGDGLVGYRAAFGVALRTDRGSAPERSSLPGSAS